MKKLFFIALFLVFLVIGGFSQVLELGIAYDFLEECKVGRVILFPESPIGLQLQGSTESISADVRFRSVSKNKKEFMVDTFRYILLGCLFFQDDMENLLLNIGMGIEFVKWNGLTMGLEGNVTFDMNDNPLHPGLNEMSYSYAAMIPRFSVFLGYQYKGDK